MLKNTSARYGLMAIGLHWVTAIAVVGLFALGLWMEDLTYYDEWYRTAPHVHKSTGILLAMLVSWRLAWRFISSPPDTPASHKWWEKKLATLAHWLMYILLFSIFITGYLIATAKGQGIDVFNWFKVPALITGIDNLEDIAGEVHETLAFALIWLAGLHALAALKHQIIDKDNTLLRMFGRSSKRISE